MSLPTGTRLGPYEILSLVGAGGMGEVYKGRDTRLDRLVAIKVLSSGSMDPERRARFEREARTVASLSNPHICPLYDVGESQSSLFLVMEYLEGSTLAARLATASLGLGEALDVAVQVADALHAAHARGIVHRDIKPANIFLVGGHAKVLDYGVAFRIRDAIVSGSPEPASDVSTALALDGRLTSPGTTVGTVVYMSPEQAMGIDTDARSDLFSLGVVLYEMATGRLPFHGSNAVAALDAVLHKAPVAPREINRRVPGELERVILKALEKPVDLRYQTAVDLLADLKRVRRDLVHGDAVAGSGHPARSGAAAGRPRRKTSSDSGLRRVAVLPFENEGGDSEMEYLSDGLTETLINSLAQLPMLQVLARSTVFRFKASADPLEAGRQLDVRALVTGRVMQRGDTLVVSAELVDVRDGSSLWGGRYQRRSAEILDVEEEIAREIVDGLRVRLTRDQRKRLAKRSTSSADAYQAYLKGRFEANQWTASGYHRALGHFNHALEKDPDFALAYAGLADLYSSLTASEIVGLPPSEQLTKARAAAQQALERDETLPEAHLALAEIKLSHDWDWRGADREFRRALELNPNLTIALHRYSHLLVPLQRWEQSLSVSRRALELDPLDPEMHVHMGWHHFHARQYDAAERVCRQALEIDQEFHEAFWFLGVALGEQGRLAEAAAAIRQAAALSDSAAERASLGYVLAKAGEQADARQVLARFERERAERHVSAYNFALVLAGFGDTEQTLQWLHRALFEHGPQMICVAVDPRFDFLHAHPAFRALVKRMRLPLEGGSGRL
jgi:eukaryotic-like serine/threonine-protein kinase